MGRLAVHLAVLAVAWWAGASFGQSDTSAGGVETEDLAVIVQELEAAGLPPSAGEKEEWSQEIASANSLSSGLFGSGLAGSVRWRGSFQEFGLVKWDSRLDLTGGPARVKARYGQDAAGAHLAGGSLLLSGKALKLVVGYLGQEAGAGLLLSPPGRGGSLAADGGFDRSRSRFVGWASTPESRTIQGVGLEAGLGAFTVLGLGGRLCLPPEGTDPDVQALTLAWRKRTLGLALSGLKIGPGRGLSVWGKKEDSFLEWSGEMALWLAGADHGPSLAWQTAVSIRPSSRLRIQGGLASGGGETHSPLGQRSALLGGDEGVGWAISGSYRPVRGAEVALLGAKNRFLSTSPETRLDQTNTWDFIARTKAANNLRLSSRLRVTTRQRWSWSDRYRWLPPVAIPLEKRFQGQISLVWEVQGGSVAVSGRFLHRETAGDPGLRTLAALSGNWRWGSCTRIRAGYGTAWGDPLDLVGAVSPVPGLVVPRHWGSWQSETYLGLALRYWGMDFQGAVSRRRPVWTDGTVPNTQLWLEARLTW